MGQSNQVVGKPTLFAPQQMTHAFIQSIFQPRFNGCIACNTTLLPPFEHIDPVGSPERRALRIREMRCNIRPIPGRPVFGGQAFRRSSLFQVWFRQREGAHRQHLHAPMNPCVSCPLRASTRVCVPWTRADERLPFQECATSFSFSWDPLRIKPRLKSVPLSSHIWRIVHSSVCPSPVSTLRCTLFAPVSIFSMVAVYD